MDISELKALISEGENFKIEFERQFSGIEKIGRRWSGLANTKGGMILFGVDDDATIYDSRRAEVGNGFDI